MKISGHLDLCGPSLIEGWLYSNDWADEKLRLQVYVGHELLGECTADRFRADLRDAGFGDGKSGFSFAVMPQHAGLDFARTRLRLLETPVFLLPNEFTRIPAQTSEEVAQAEVAGSHHFTQKHLVGADLEVADAEAPMALAAKPEPAPRRGGSFFKAMIA